MRMRTIATLGLAALALAGCQSRPRQLPPAPPSDSMPAESDPSGASEAQIGGAILPGSRADFLQTVMSDRVFFAFDSYALDESARRTLDSQAEWLIRNPAVRVVIEGHCDERGTREYNLALGDRRANAARDYLEARGVSAGRMQTISWGKERPAAEGSHEGAWAQNRRAVTVVPQ
ncbi:MAG: peptidoglycan-associated lipoprotein Pal [Sphingosinicella sp.]